MQAKALFILFLLPVIVWAQHSVSPSESPIYKTVQDDGTVIYSDRAVSGSTSVSLLGTSVIMSSPATAQPVATQASNTLAPVIEYRVAVLSPLPEATIRDNLGRLDILVEVIPKKTGKFQLVINNQIVKTQSKGKFVLENVARGAHSIEVHFFDNSGKILASSKPQSLFMHQASALIHTN
jgi:hypothetical protein